MATFNARKTEAVKEKQVAGLIQSLSSLRIAGKSDVILVCGEREFLAHRLILEASSPYFETMFHSGLEESKSGRVVFDNMEPATLESVLDFIYLGEVDKLQTPGQLKETLQVSHMMHLEHLFTYCCDSLLCTLSIETLSDIGEVALLYNREKMLEPFLDYMLTHRVEILASNQFWRLSVEIVKEFLRYSVNKQLCMNDMLGALMKWLRADLAVRKSFANELLQTIGVELVTQQYVAGLLKDEDLMQSSDIIANSLRAFSASVLMWVLERSQVVPAALDCGRANIVFFSQHSPQSDAKDVAVKSEINGNSWPTYIQQFDVQNLSWLPVQVVGANIAGAAFSQNKQYVYVVGGRLGPLVVMYSVQSRSVEYTNTALFKETMNAGACFLEGGVYRAGGSDDTALNVYYSSEDSFLRREVHDFIIGNISYSRSSPVLLTTADNYVFVIGGNDNEGLIIEYGSHPRYRTEKISWQTLIVPNFPKMLSSHFYVAKDTLQGVCFGNKMLIKLKFNKTSKRLETNHFRLVPPDKQTVNGVYQHPDPDSSMMFVSTVQEGPSIPNYLWEPETGKWTRLPLPTGRCSLINCGSIVKKMYIVEV